MAAQDVVRTSVAAPLAYKLHVGYAECDPRGVVFNAHFLAYLDIGITEPSAAIASPCLESVA